MDTLSEIARKIREERRQKSDEEYEKSRAETKAKLNNYLKEFEIGFEEEVILLKAAGIQYTAHFNSIWEYKGAYIKFSKGGAELKMDFLNRERYRFEYTGGEGKQGTMVYGNWDKEEFILWIDDNLIKKQ